MPASSATSRTAAVRWVSTRPRPPGNQAPPMNFAFGVRWTSSTPGREPPRTTITVAGRGLVGRLLRSRQF